MTDSPYMKALRDAADSPHMKALRDMADSPHMKALRDIADSPHMKALRDMVDSPYIKALRDAADSPYMKALRDAADSPYMEALRDAASSPYMKAVRDMADSPHVKALRDMADSPHMRALRDALDSSHLKAFRDAPDSLKMLAARDVLADGLSTSDRLRISGALLGAPPRAVRTSLIANEVVAVAKADGRLADFVGESFIFDAMAADSVLEAGESVESGLAAFFGVITAVIRKYLSAVNSVPELAGLTQLAMLVLTAAALHYAEQAPSAQDVQEIGTKIESRTIETRRSFDALERQFNELLQSVQQLTLSKQQELAPRRLYVVRRAVDVKAERNMRSETVGRIEAGDKVSIIRIDKKWIEFNYFDYTLGRASKGWAVKKYFDRLK